MSSSGGANEAKWSVFEDVKSSISAAPEALMDDINAAISALEYARAASFLQYLQPPSTYSKPKTLLKT
ncbi:hypothetical protein C2S52_010127 [Perilla frutescens var. hirtella]|uniref:Uncharacterized protein n=1 Tax=Perilla frutescens var. hirtella TaxID=608512 RepID=A0AAD4NWG6_PERFH|nr:hypothetical protein C2S53_009973 [Perilla frutescens var. hirtella]KAH6778890.1 hypothetical protein C2S52_010127 [Perilla frutescens var. hirtella]KAH6816973.1 hypothetical protein C2S51_000576 [Perilla frutescens var. frutescens]